MPLHTTSHWFLCKLNSMNGKAGTTPYLLDINCWCGLEDFAAPLRSLPTKEEPKSWWSTQNGTCLECAHCLESFQMGLKSIAGGKMNWFPNWSELTDLGVQETPIYIVNNLSQVPVCLKLVKITEMSIQLSQALVPLVSFFKTGLLSSVFCAIIYKYVGVLR